MIKLSSAQEQEIIYNAYVAEFEKQASIYTAGAKMMLRGLKRFGGKAGTGGEFRHMARRASMGYSKAGGKGALKALSGYRDPFRMATGKGAETYRFLKAQQVMKGTRKMFGRGMRSSIGNTSQRLLDLSANMKGKSIIGKPVQAVKNIAQTFKNELKGERFKEVLKANDRIIRNMASEATHVKGRGPKWLFKDRKIVGTTNRGSYVIKKRKAAYATMTLPVTAPGSAALTYLGSKRKESGERRSQLGRVGRAAGDAALYGISPALGIAAPVLMGTAGMLAARRKKAQQNSF